jgi:hypothetical protein
MRHAHKATLPRRLAAGMRTCSGGAGKPSSMKAMNSSRERGRSAGLKRRSKPMVELGLPLMARPQAEPAKCGG